VSLFLTHGYFLLVVPGPWLFPSCHSSLLAIPHLSLLLVCCSSPIITPHMLLVPPYYSLPIAAFTFLKYLYPLNLLFLLLTCLWLLLACVSLGMFCSYKQQEKANKQGKFFFKLFFYLIIPEVFLFLP
jgi:hypothetical protein